MKHLISLFCCLLITVSVAAQTGHIKILSVNDMHASIDQMPKLKALADSLRGVEPNLIILSAGDNRTGNPHNDTYPETSLPMTMLMNKVGFNASAIGNHEFDSKVEGLRNVINKSNFPYLCANAFFDDTLRMHVYPYKIMERNGVKIGIVGGVQINSAGIPDSHPDVLKGITFRHIDDVLPSYEWLRKQVDVLLLLSHDGYEVDTMTAKKFPYYDAIIGGHSHVIADNEFYNGVLVNQAGNKLKYANITDIFVKDGKVVRKFSKLFNLTKYTKEDAKTKEMVASFKNNPYLKEKLTEVISPFQTAEELGIMETDALREELGVDVAIQNGGNVRYSTFPVGDFTVGDLLALDPFGNSAVVYELTGKELEDFIMNNLDVDEKQPVYVSGCTYVMKVKKGATKETTHPVSIKITMNKGKFNPKAKYKVVTNSYAASVSTSAKADKGTTLVDKCSDITMRWLRRQPSLNYTGKTCKKIEYVK